VKEALENYKGRQTSEVELGSFHARKFGHENSLGQANILRRMVLK